MRFGLIPQRDEQSNRSLNTGLRLGLGLTLLLVLLGESVALGDEPTSVTLQQVYVHLPSVVAYMDVLHADETPFSGLGVRDFRAVLADQWLSFDSVEPFEKTGDGVTYIAVVDVSRSIRLQQFEDMIAALRMWVNHLSSKDRMALVAIGNTARLVQDFTASKANLLARLDQLKPNGSRTALYASLIEGMQITKGRVDLPLRRALVVLTDGRNDDDTTGSSEEDVHQAIEQYRTPIFAIGITRKPPPRNADPYLAILAGFASSSHGIYVPLEESSIGGTYDQILDAIRRVYVGRLSCARCPHDGRKYAFKVIAGGRESVAAQLTLFPPTPPPPAKRSFRWLIVGLADLLAVVIVLLVAWRLNWFKPHAPPPALPPPPPRPSMPLTLVTIGGQRQYKAALIDRITVGRDHSCEVCVDSDDTIAPRHCELYMDAGNVYVRNLDSSARTAVNGALIQMPQQFESNDIIRVGRSEFRVLFGGG